MWRDAPYKVPEDITEKGKSKFHLTLLFFSSCTFDIERQSSYVVSEVRDAKAVKIGGNIRERENSRNLGTVLRVSIHCEAI